MGKFATMEQYELKIDEEGGLMQVRQQWDEATNVMLNFGVHKRIEGLVPDDFRPFFERWCDGVGCESNDTLGSVDIVGNDEGVDTVKAVAKAPWPISDRIMFSTRYIEFDVDGGHMMLFSGDGNQRYINDPEKYTEREKKKLVLAHCFLSGWWVKPVVEDGNVVATEMLYYSAIEAGGNIPTFVQNSQGPKTALNSVKGAIAWTKKNKGN